MDLGTHCELLSIIYALQCPNIPSQDYTWIIIIFVSFIVSSADSILSRSSKIFTQLTSLQYIQYMRTSLCGVTHLY